MFYLINFTAGFYVALWCIYSQFWKYFNKCLLNFISNYITNAKFGQIKHFPFFVFSVTAYQFSTAQNGKVKLF